MHSAPHACRTAPARAPAAPAVARVPDEPCPKCGQMSGPTHWARCDLEPCPKCWTLSRAAHRASCTANTGAAPSSAEPGPRAAPSVLEPDASGEWTQDDAGHVYDPDGQLWEGDEDPPGLDVTALPVRAKPEAAPPTLSQDASGGAGTGQGPPHPRKPRRGPVPWQALPPAPEDTPWRVTRDVEVRTLSPNRLMSEHWRSRSSRRNREHKAVAEAFAGATLPPLEPGGWITTFVRVGPSLLDHGDRLSGSLSAIRDAIADRLTGGDDSPRAPVAWVYRQHREVVREPHRFPARLARAGDSARGIAPRPSRPARDAWRYRSFLRVTVETSVEHVAGDATVACAEGPRATCERAPEARCNAKATW